MMRSFHDAKLMAKTLRQAMSESGCELSHSAALEIVSRQFGFDSWNVLAARLNGEVPKNDVADTTVSIQPAIPVFRIFSVEKAMEFYRDFLGFKVEWEHRFGDNFPLYCELSRSGMILHLSEHAGDASPGARAFVPIRGVRDLHRELTDKEYRYMKPGIEEVAWGLQLTVTDPFNNRIVFCERIPKEI